MDLTKLLLGSEFGICVFCEKAIKREKAVFYKDGACVCHECNSLIKIAPFDFTYPGTENVALVISPMYYSGIVRDAIKTLKFGSMPGIADILAYYAVTYLSTFTYEDGFFSYIDEIVPVPLSPDRKSQRGYNQSFLLAKAISDEFKVSLNDTSLKKIKNNAAQSTLSRKKRKENVLDAYSCDNAVCGKRILLVDDVFTTGNTLDSCARTLIDSGATKVSAFTMTHGASKSHSLEYYDLFS